MRSLSKREIYLIYTAVLLLVFYVGNIVLGIPAKAKYEETAVRLAEVELEKKNLERRLENADAIEREYARKKESAELEMERFGRISTGTKLEQYLLACLETAGLEPVRTMITEPGNWEEDGYLTGSIEVAAQGSQEAAVKLLDYLKEHPALSVESYVLYPEAGTDGELWSVTAGITCNLPASWEEVTELMLED